MNKKELVTAISEKAGLTKGASEKALNAVVSTITEAVAHGDSVTLVGFGAFKSVARSAREGRNPQTGKKIKVDATVTPKFTAGSVFKDAVKNAGQRK